MTGEEGVERGSALAGRLGSSVSQGKPAGLIYLPTVRISPGSLEGGKWDRLVGCRYNEAGIFVVGVNCNAAAGVGGGNRNIHFRVGEIVSFYCRRSCKSLNVICCQSPPADR